MAFLYQISPISSPKDMQLLNLLFKTVFVFHNKVQAVSHNEIIGDFPRISSREGFHLVSTR